MSAYTDSARIAAYLGATLTAGQEIQAGLAAAAASDWIDEYKGRSWQGSSPVTGEVHAVNGDRVYLDHRPITAMTTVEVRAAVIGASWTTLAAGQYEIADADAGILRLTGWGNYEARVAYTHTGTTAPPAIAFAATIIAGSLLGPTLRPSTDGLESVSVGQNDINVKFRVDYGDVPEKALSLLGARGVVVA